MKALILLCISLSASPLFAGDHFFGDVAVLATIKSEAENYREFPETYPNFIEERDRVENAFKKECPIEFTAYHSSIEIGQGEMPNAQPFKENYWILVHFMPTAYYPDNEQAYVDHLNATFPECGGDIYKKDVHIGYPNPHPVCSWARDNNPEIFEELCKAAYDSILGSDGS